MSEDEPIRGSLAGFTDYQFVYPIPDTAWTVIGIIFLVINFIAYMPQPITLIVERTSYGLSPISLYGQSLCHFLLIVNIVCLHPYDFVGVIQYPFSHRAMIRFLTFISLFSQWVMFLPCVLLATQYHDRESRTTKDKKFFLRNWIQTIAAVGGLLLTDLSFLLAWISLSDKYGFHAKQVRTLGELVGYISTAMDIAQFFPQLIETCTIREPGSLSLVMLEIQAPSDMAQSLFMWLGQHDDLTTWLCLFADSVAEFILLFTCWGFSCHDRAVAKRKAQQQSIEDHIFASLEIQPIQIDDTALLAIRPPDF